MGKDEGLMSRNIKIIYQGGPAFPQTRDMTKEGTEVHFPGITIRDYFAAQAMVGLTLVGFVDRQVIAEKAYDQADEMLRQRKP